MRKNKTKYLVIGTIIVILISVSSIGVNLLKSEPKEEKEKTISQEKTKSMLSYTLNGEKTDIKPTKEDGYIANKIICENGSNLIWDNTNWEVEIVSLESNDICSVDFTKNTSTEGYRITVTTNVEESIDSLSKATIKNGTIIFYPNKGQEITSVNGCTGVVENNKVIVNNVTGNQTCNIEVKIPLKTLYVTLTDGSKYEQWRRTSTNTYDEINKTEVGFNTVFGGTTITQGYNQTGKIYKVDTEYESGTLTDYYFSGNPSDNWVKFAGFWWRIIRTNESEGTRLLYAGTTHDGQDGYINNTTYQWNNDDSTLGNNFWSKASFSGSSGALTQWYSSNIIGTNDSMVNDIVYCNDTSYKIDSETSGWGTNGRKYGAYTRLIESKTPNHICGTNSFGAASKVGMMTADEVAYVGGVWGQNAPNTFYYRNSRNNCTNNTDVNCSSTGSQDWWTLSPYGFNGGRANLIRVRGADSRPGGLAGNGVNELNAVRPVITLLPSVKVSGSGTTDDPFIPSLD